MAGVAAFALALVVAASAWSDTDAEKFKASLQELQARLAKDGPTAAPKQHHLYGLGENGSTVIPPTVALPPGWTYKDVVKKCSPGAEQDKTKDAVVDCLKLVPAVLTGYLGEIKAMERGFKAAHPPPLLPVFDADSGCTTSTLNPENCQCGTVSVTDGKGCEQVHCKLGCTDDDVTVPTGTEDANTEDVTNPETTPDEPADTEASEPVIPDPAGASVTTSTTTVAPTSQFPGADQAPTPGAGNGVTTGAGNGETTGAGNGETTGEGNDETSGETPASFIQLESKDSSAAANSEIEAVTKQAMAARAKLTPAALHYLQTGKIEIDDFAKRGEVTPDIQAMVDHHHFGNKFRTVAEVKDEMAHMGELEKDLNQEYLTERKRNAPILQDLKVVQDRERVVEKELHEEDEKEIQEAKTMAQDDWERAHRVQPPLIQVGPVSSPQWANNVRALWKQVKGRADEEDEHAKQEEEQIMAESVARGTPSPAQREEMQLSQRLVVDEEELEGEKPSEDQLIAAGLKTDTTPIPGDKLHLSDADEGMEGEARMAEQELANAKAAGEKLAMSAVPPKKVEEPDMIDGPYGGFGDHQAQVRVIDHVRPRKSKGATNGYDTLAKGMSSLAEEHLRKD